MKSGNQPSCAAFSSATEIARASPSFKFAPAGDADPRREDAGILEEFPEEPIDLVARDGDEIAALILAEEHRDREWSLS